MKSELVIDRENIYDKTKVRIISGGAGMGIEAITKESTNETPLILQEGKALPLISVIVPIYRAETYLERCLESICDQTYRNLQIILVDDGSPDNCPDLCDVWAERDSRIRVIHQPNKGVSSSFQSRQDTA